MLCQNCNKEEATVHFTEIIDGKVIELNLCKKCAEKKGINLTIADDLSEFISSLSGDHLQPEDDGRCCPNCGLSFKELRQGGRLGCGECYRTFEDVLSALISNIHKGPKHTGKVPPGAKKKKQEEKPLPGNKIKQDIEDRKTKIGELKKKIQSAIEAEEYEKAAIYRDLIKELEKNS